MLLFYDAARKLTVQGFIVEIKTSTFLIFRMFMERFSWLQIDYYYEISFFLGTFNKERNFEFSFEFRRWLHAHACCLSRSFLNRANIQIRKVLLIDNKESNASSFIRSATCTYPVTMKHLRDIGSILFN